MDIEDVGSMLRSGKATPDLGGVGALLSKLDRSSEACTSGLLQYDGKIAFPVFLTNRSGLRVDIYGKVIQDTKEFNQGYRFFDSNGHLYKEDGKTRGEHPGHDLVSQIEESLVNQYDAPSNHQDWVDPRHHQATNFFKQLDMEKHELVAGCTYLNRMGFVVKISNADFKNVDNVYRDNMGSIYYSSGRRFQDADSMQDLVYQIINWDLFTRSEYVYRENKGGSSSPEDDDNPELFDPMADNQQLLMEDFYKCILRARDLAKKLDIDFGYHINDAKSKGR